MKNDVSIVDLAGVLTLPLVSELFAMNGNLNELKVLFHQLNLLYENNRHVLAFDIIYDLIRKAKLEVPYLFYETIATNQDKHNFVGEFLADLNEILDELSE